MIEEAVMNFELKATRIDSAGSKVHCKEASLEIDTSLIGRVDALNPVELLLASFAACMLKGVERLSPSLNFQYSDVKVYLKAQRPKQEARISEIHYELQIATQESQARLDLLHKNLNKFGTIYNSLKSGTTITGNISVMTV